jgi:hypothetical protein
MNPVSNSGLEFCGMLTRERQRWQGQVAPAQLNYRPALFSERAPHTENPKISEDNFRGRENKLVAHPRWSLDTGQTGRLTVGR